MPLTIVPTHDEGVNPPVLNIEVSDGGGGDKPHTVDLFVWYDPLYVQFKNKIVPKNLGKYEHKPSRTQFRWFRYLCPPGGRDFKLGLKSRGKGDSVVLMVAVDLENGEIKPASIVIKNA